jgi:hypothetical protein
MVNSVLYVNLIWVNGCGGHLMVKGAGFNLQYPCSPQLVGVSFVARLFEAEKWFI